MGYPAFNLTTIQLPAPTSNLTKAEYKSVYGIDLDSVNIRSFKLVVYGNEKYPIDQIKEVEEGIKIYFNGRILSITDTIETSDEIYDVVNAKPIYFHPVVVLHPEGAESSKQFNFSLIILNNSPAPINTWTKLLDTFRSIASELALNEYARFPVTGNVYTTSGKLLISTIESINSPTPSEQFLGVYVTDFSRATVSLSAMDGTPRVFDGVNKIN